MTQLKIGKISDKMRQGWPHGRPKEAPRVHKMATKGAKRAQDGPKRAPREPKMTTRWPKIEQDM